MVSIRRKRLIAEAAAAAAAAEAARVEALHPIEKLQMIQEKLGKINTEANSKILDIEKMYTEMRKPVYNKRNEIISKIPDFWLTVFLKHPTLKKLLTEEDEKILEYMDSLYVENLADHQEGYCITFNFRANPYFTNTQLTKTIELSGEGTLRSRGTTINWMAGKGPAEVRSDGGEGSTQPSSSDSFFSWFSSPEGDEAEMDQDLFADIINSELWLNPFNCIDNADDSEDDDEDHV